MSSYWQTTRFKIDLTKPQVMGIINITPDSFSDGGRYDTSKAAIEHAQKLLKDGATILDLGAESTRPGTPTVPLDVELERLIPVLKEIVKLEVPLSIDTYKPEVMQIALDEGADIINDIWGLRMPNALQTIASHAHCGVCIMHMHGEPQTMQVSPMEGKVTPKIKAFLQKRSHLLKQLNVEHERIVWDYGIGFGKTVAQNFELLACQKELLSDEYPLLAGWSRKSSLGVITQRLVDERMPASVAVAVLAVDRGARIVRVHDVKETVDALKIWQAMNTFEENMLE